jgi:hypothetical protein
MIFRSQFYLLPNANIEIGDFSNVRRLNMALDYTKRPSDRRTGVWVGPSGGSTLGITDPQQPLAAEINNTGGTSGMQFASDSISWNDFSFGMQESETTNEPSLSDSAAYEEFGQANYGGSISYWLPAEYDDNSNQHSIIYDLTDQPGEINDIVVRVDGDVLATAPAADGDMVSVFRAQGAGEQNPFTPGESKRRTVNYTPRGEFSHFTVVGTHTINAIPAATTPWAAGSKGRLRAAIQGRDVTNMMEFSSSDPTVVNVYPGGFYEVVGDAADAATITISEPGTTNTATQSVTVTA